MATEFTQYFRLRLPDFRTSPWHDEINANTADIDSVLYRSLVAQNIEVWVNDFEYTIGDIAIDSDSVTFWLCTTDHTSGAGTFEADRTANPTYWSSISLGLQTRGAWTNDTPYQLSDLVYDTVLGIVAICTTPHISSPIPATIETDEANWEYIVDISNVLSAASLSFTPAGDIEATNVQDAIEELDGDIDDILAEIDALEALVTADVVYGDIASNSLATEADIWSNALSKLVSARELWDAAAPVDLGNKTGAITLDCATGLNFKCVITGNVTIANPTSLKEGQSGSLLLTQDGTGGYSITLTGNQFFPVGGAALTFVTTADKHNVITFQRLSSAVIVVSGGRLQT